MKVKVSCNHQEAITIEDSAPQTVQLQIHDNTGIPVKTIAITSKSARLLADVITHVAKGVRP